MCFILAGTNWRSKTFFGTLLTYSTLTESTFFCTVIFTNGRMQKQVNISGNKEDSFRLSFLLYLIRPEGRIFVFARTRQVVF